MAGNVDEEALHQLYLWVDNIPLSRPKRNLSRDFSDGGMCSSVCAPVCPHVLFCMYVRWGLCAYMSLYACVLLECVVGRHSDYLLALQL